MGKLTIINQKNKDQKNKKREYLILAVAYAILAVAKKDISVNSTQSESPGVATSGAFF